MPASIGNYTIRDETDAFLGRGGFAEVFRAWDGVRKEEVAIKIISKEKVSDPIVINRISNEIRIHKKLQHQSIVKFIDCFEDSDNIFIVLELCTNGNMYQFMKGCGRLQERAAAKFCFQLIEAMQHLHSGHRVIHRDLKLSNILLDNNLNLKLCDFGLATEVHHPDEEHYTICGTPNYISPEVVSEQAHGFPADMWSLGCLCYAVLTGNPPFEQRGEMKVTLQRIKDGDFCMPTDISQEAQDFLRSLLNLDPTKRPTAQQVIRHPFLALRHSPVSHTHSHQGQAHVFSDKKLFHEWSYSPLGGARDPNGSSAATALVAYDGRPVEDDNGTTVNAHPCLYKGDEHVSRMLSGEREGEGSTFNSDLQPQQLHLRPETQHSFCLRSVQEHQILPPQPVAVTPSPPASPRHALSETLSISPNFQTPHLDPHRQSYPLPSRNTRHSGNLLTRPSPRHADNGRLLVNTRAGGCGHSLALSMDSSLHCGGSITINSSMSSTQFDISRNSSTSASNIGTNASGMSPHLDASMNNMKRRRAHGSAGRGLQLWVPRSRSGATRKGRGSPGHQQFCYCAPRGDVLVVSGGGDVVYLTYMRDKSKELKPCRLSVRAGEPLKLKLGRVTKRMCQEIRDIRDSSLRESACSLLTEDASEAEAAGKDCLSRKSGGGFIGKESFPEKELDILKDISWVDSFRVTELPTSLRKTYTTVSRMLEKIKFKLPKLILYLTENAKEDTANNHTVCKCMIMCNDPLPDFYVRWSDGTKLRYSLSDGKLHITNNKGNRSEQYRWEGSASSGADWASSAPASARKYLLLAQSAMRRCIDEDMKHHKKVERDGCAIQYPIIVVESIADT